MLRIQLQSAVGKEQFEQHALIMRCEHPLGLLDAAKATEYCHHTG
jgi:hypothetical protein